MGIVLVEMQLLVLWRLAEWHCTQHQCCVLTYTLMENGQRSPRAECSDQPSLKTRLSCSQDPRSFSLNVEAQGGTSSPVLLLSRSPARRRRGVPTYPMHSQGLAVPSGYSESHLAQSEKKKKIP